MAGASIVAREAKRKRRVVRRLWGKDKHARFRGPRARQRRHRARDPVGDRRPLRRNARRVSEGKVLVRDLHRKRSVLLTAGHAYLARHKRH